MTSVTAISKVTEVSSIIIAVVVASVVAILESVSEEHTSQQTGTGTKGEPGPSSHA
jgi:hypothetical protein